jgi:2-oxoglutarate ferredoxin oxidoreductase subunit delta
MEKEATINQVQEMDGNLPEAPDSPAKSPQKQYRIDIFHDWCKSCGICAAFCPRSCIRMDSGQPVVEADRCTGCRFCEIHCPDFAICVQEVKSPQTQEEPHEE